MEPVKILIAEDESVTALVLENLLAKEGFTVSVASDGEEALARARSDRPALLLLDLMMPKKTGFEVCRALREDPEFGLLPIVMLTAKSQAADKLLGFEVGADDYVIKPFDRDALLARLRALLRRRQPPVQEGSQPPELSPATIRTGLPSLDQALGGGLPGGSNLLLIGPTGSG